MKLSVSALIATLFAAPIAWSQCAPGVAPAGNPGCIPQDRPESPYFHGNPDQLGSSAPTPTAVWANRWGAIVADTKNGKTGVSTAQASRNAATRLAMNECNKHGGLRCELILAYHDQCAAVAYGSGLMGYAGSPTEMEAKQLALKKCANTECKVVYSACSLPERIQ